MGLCLSCHCGEAQQKAAVVAVSISHGGHSALSPVTRPKRCTESSKVSPRPSIELGIPHSSELFSLPSEGSDADSPTRGSIARSSTSSMTHRPSLPGRFSSVRKSCSSQVVPAETLLETGRFSSVRKSCSSQVVPAETLLETIARLEKLCDVKLLNLDSSNSVAPESTTSILLRDSCRDLAQKLSMCFANEQAVAPANSESSMPVTLSEVERLEANDVDPGEAITRNSAAMRRLPSLRSQDGDENIQFTDFEATFELLAAQTPSASEAAAAQPPPTEHSASQIQPAHRRSRTSSELSGLLHAKGVQKQKGKKNPMLLRPALTDISANVTEPRKTPQLMKAQTVKRGSSRSLDLRNCSLSQLEFDTLLKSSQRWQSKLGAVEMSRKEESSRTEAEEPLITATEEPLRTAAAEDCQSVVAKDSQRTEAEDTSIIDSEDNQTTEAKESRSTEAVDYQGLEAAEDEGLEAAEDQGLEATQDQGLTTAEDQGLEDDDSQPSEAEDPQRNETAENQGLEDDDSQPSEAEDPQRNEAAENQGLETDDTSRTGVDLELSLGDEQDNRPSSSADATPSQGRASEDDEEGEAASEEGDDGASVKNNNNSSVTVSDECLALVFENLLKLLQQSSPVELAHNASQLLRLLAAQPSDEIPESSGDIQVSEAASSESWHDAPVSLSSTEQPVVYNTTEDLELLPEGVPEALHNDLSSNTPNLSI